MTLNDILNYIDVGAPMLTLFFFIKPYKKMNRDLLFIFLFVWAEFSTNLAASILSNAKINNYSMYVANMVLTFSLISCLFYRMVNKAMDKAIIGAFVIFVIITIVSLANRDGIDFFNSIISAYASFVITAYCLIFFYWKLVNDDRSIGLTDTALFWIVIGIFTYFSGSFFIFISYKYLIVEEGKMLGIVWRFHNVLLAIFCVYTIYGLTCKNYQ